jgi:uncharacterized LabA/DUF88 family protein
VNLDYNNYANSHPPALPQGSGRVIFLQVIMVVEPTHKRTVAFIDGQNLFHAVKMAFRYYYPNYDVNALARAVCKQKGWDLVKVRFYTGIPNQTEDPYWHHFWRYKLRVMGGEQKIHIYSRVIKHGKEKGIDLRIALDVVRMAYRGEYDVALIFSQDQDFSEVAEEIRVIAKEQDRWIKVASAFPDAPDVIGIAKTDWIKIDKATYDSCIDRRDYRPKGVRETEGKS